jgi:hypothetical protein
MQNKIFLIAIIFIGLISNIFPQTLFRSGMFLHHSTGGVIWNNATPNIPQLIADYNTEHNYTGDDAVTLNIYPDFFPPLREYSDNYYDSWHAVLVGQSPYPEDVEQMQQFIQNNKIVVIKSCWGAVDISSIGDPADTLVIEDYGYNGRTYNRLKWHWRNIVSVMQSHSDRFFVIWNGIPLVPGPGYDGTLAHQFCKWAKDTLATGNDPVFGDFPENVYVFDSFHLLADPNILWGMNANYHDAGDNHPNVTGDNVVAPLFVTETFDAAITYEGLLPVELISFSVSIIPLGVELNWSTATELNNDRFEIQKNTNDGEFITIGFVKGQGTSTRKNDYSFIDKNTNSGKYLYRLKQIDFDGNYEYSNVLEVDFNTITTYSLEQNYPNPFNPSTEINYTLAKSGNVTLKVYNNLGSIVAILVDGFMRSGKHSVKFNAKDFTSGVYFYRIETDNFASTRKMLLIK